MSKIAIKFCGLNKPQDFEAASQAGAAYIGLNFFPKSPRYVLPEDAASLVRPGSSLWCKVGLTVDATDAELDAIIAAVPLDMLQLHGAETPERVAAVKSRYGLPVMKAVGVRGADDLPALDAHARVADQILVDAKAPKGAPLPGGNGVAFDWELIAERRWPIPWLLAGGLTSRNVCEGIRLTGARQVDVSSGIETSPGHKDPAMMLGFADSVRQCEEADATM